MSHETLIGGGNVVLCLFEGFPETSSDSETAYRAEMLPGLGFILKRSFYEKYMNKMSECCAARFVRVRLIVGSAQRSFLAVFRSLTNTSPMTSMIITGVFRPAGRSR